MAGLTSLVYVGGAGQVIVYEASQLGEHVHLAEPIRVQVVGPCGPVAGVKVHFEAANGGLLSEGTSPSNKYSNKADVPTDSDGMAACYWWLKVDALELGQKASAQLPDLPDGRTPNEPRAIEFNASLVPLSESKGGGCCVVVKPGQLAETIRLLLDEKVGKNDIQICLLPGPEPIDELAVSVGDRKVSLDIRGCGAAVPLTWDKPWVLDGLQVFHLRDVSARTAAPGLLMLKNCTEVWLESCRLDQVIEDNAADAFLCYIAGASHVYLSQNALRSHVAAGGVKPGEILDGLPSDVLLADIFAAPDASTLRSRAAEAAKAIASQPVARRKVFVEGLQASLQKYAGRIPDVETAVYKQVIELMSARAVNAVALGEVFVNLAGVTEEAASGTGHAVILECPTAAVRIVDNEMLGRLCVYGRPPDIDLKDDELKVLAVGLKEGAHALVPAAGTLHLRGNRLSDLVGCSNDLVEKIRAILTQKGTVTDIYRAVFLSENRLPVRAQTATLMLAARVTVTANSFESAAGGRVGAAIAGAVIANSATYTGNLAEDVEENVVLFDISRYNSNSHNQAAQSGMRVQALA